MKKIQKEKLSLHRDTVIQLQTVAGGRLATPVDATPSAGPAICWLSDCNPCDPSPFVVIF